jgi:uncharacterized oxidoreductase
MKITENTVLITGGSAGIGLATAKQLAAKNNHVIIIGRNQERLRNAASELPNVTAINADVTNAEDVDQLVDKLTKEFPALNIVINNAGSAQMSNLLTDTDNFEKASGEILTNYLSIIRLNEKLLPLLQQQPSAAIVNVSSVVAFVPGSALAGYSASKAALHSYTQSLRLFLSPTSVKVFELMPPLVDTEFSAEIGGHNGIKPAVVAQELIEGLENDNFEIRIGDTEQIYQLYRSSPEDAFNAMNSQG